MATTPSLMAASLEEVQDATNPQKGNFTFPAMAIPFGADDRTPCRFFTALDEVTEEDFAILLDDSYPMLDNVRRVHFITTRETKYSNHTLSSVFYLLDH